MAEIRIETDVVVIGAGAVGENAADRTVQGGLDTVVVEAELVGGECSYWACMPSKALLRSAAVLREVRAVPGAAEAVTGELDVAAVLRRRDAFTHDWDDRSQVEWLDGAGIRLVRGHARLTGERELLVTAEDGSRTRVHARRAVVLATGSAALLPDIAGLEDARPWTSREATSAKRGPASLAILGGGVVGVEMATAYAGFGTAVTLVARGGLLSSLEPAAGDAVLEGLRELGVEVRLGVETIGASRGEAGVTLALGDGSSVTAEELLVAVGRAPRTGDLGLETAGLEPGAWLEVDDALRVKGLDWLWAVGDVNHRALLTHQGKYQARAAGDAIAALARGEELDDRPWGAHVATADHDAVPQVVFSHPEVAAIGLTAAEAERRGLRSRVVDYDLGGIAGASVEQDGYQGTARLVVDEDRGVVVGATFVGPRVSDLLQAATIAIVGEVPIRRLWHAVPAYPTVSEIWLRLLESLGRETA
ncbi:dihydrolipoyl dehydrogenase family protein [Homoserinibacter sp. YIM 151385]|uniref:dihydrolipoyl dehydrogenase family protein n=1 Tax=Homoserinibacter sp. YIM 151385 TaxID=2985506 RepID=UPI0022EFE0D7|nr:NAD(P)/FAD-dependent oxidoreductase [Homoserinibacter sp. YIM 151385]WBU38261.1 NAD(P)/FAD-dependent oxidoreductase [Homoserinibacter sp. YIM 151385]